MSKLVIKHDGPDIVSWRYEADHDYVCEDDEFCPEVEPDHRELDSKIVDTSTDPPSVVDDPDHDPRTPLEKAQDRIEQLESATGTGEEGKRGIASRLDELEDRIAALEDLHA